MTSSRQLQGPFWKMSLLGWASIIAVIVVLIVPFYGALKQMVETWSHKEEYSYGYMIPFVTLFLIWQKKESLERLAFTGSWAGILITLLGLGLFVAGDLSTIKFVIQYSFLIMLAGLVLALTGWQAFKVIWIPLLVLVFMIPLPQFFLQEISAQLQLVSSEIGVWIIRFFGVSVFLEGNVIDLGIYKLQVVEACSGLRYLFPLMALGFIAAYFFKVALWKRAFVFLSTIPITVLMNSFRIGMIGILVEYRGQSMAEGFLHDFEGWAIFMACTALLVVEMWALAKIGSDRMPFRQAFELKLPESAAGGLQLHWRTLPRPYLAGMLIVLILALIAAVIPERIEAPLPRKDFSSFPMALGEWKGKPEGMEQIYLDALKLDDYVLANFADRNHNTVNLYAAYYASQRTGESTHSPRTCIPGGGWAITSLTQETVGNVKVGASPLRVNRAVIQLGDKKQLTYYWFQERGRIITNEYLVKWFIFWDALTKNRSDGALVRLVTPITPREDVAVADQRLSAFASLLSTHVEDYIPGSGSIK